MVDIYIGAMRILQDLIFITVTPFHTGNLFFSLLKFTHFSLTRPNLNKLFSLFFCIFLFFYHLKKG